MKICLEVSANRATAYGLATNRSLALSCGVIDLTPRNKQNTYVFGKQYHTMEEIV